MVNKSLKVLIFILLVSMVSSCRSKSFDSKEALLVYLKDTDNGYHFQKSINGIDYSLTYRPTDLMVLQSTEDGPQTDNVAEFRKKYADYLYFNLGMSANGKELLSHNLGSRAEFGAMVNQLAFGMAEKVNLIGQQRDTLPLLDYVFPRTYGMGNRTNMLLVYERNPKAMQQDYILFTIRDLGFGTGEVSFKIDTKKIEYQPQLKF
ncbi:hypothetical protein HME9304_02747 [Flagellimonas maritima]|uniref:Uncharacterized protein n=1 Tax=Flagellimonas maritima TaxID=1383885 RepID=A0A2Z4LVI9_9FLAO|nr:hypothetical protein [Allomuricauda aurantiaca]AWX45720.1 hypothetical protein HME9304_02747 [Allomuricauda aurantiaca]